MKAVRLSVGNASPAELAKLARTPISGSTTKVPKLRVKARAQDNAHPVPDLAS